MLFMRSEPRRSIKRKLVRPKIGTRTMALNIILVDQADLSCGGMNQAIGARRELSVNLIRAIIDACKLKDQAFAEFRFDRPHIATNGKIRRMAAVVIHIAFHGSL